MSKKLVENVVSYLVAKNVVKEETARELNLDQKSVRELIDEFILPRVVCVGGQDTRGWRISDTFMELMAQFGSDFVREESFAGNILMEIALQRLSAGAVLHEPVQLLKLLPGEYQKYSAAWDQSGLMSKKCWEFISTQLPFCLTSLEPKYNDHARKILFGLLGHLSADGETKGGYLWNEELCEKSVVDAWRWVSETAVQFYGAREVGVFYAASCDWHQHKVSLMKLMRAYPEVWDGFRSTQLPEFETYYTGFRRKMMEIMGVYEDRTWDAIWEELVDTPQV